MDKIIKALSEMDGVIAGDGVSKEVIADAEEKLGLKFSNEYENYLLAYGVIAVNGHELTGLGASSRVNVVDVTKNVIETQGVIVNSGYVIENDNIDNVVYWQKSTGEIVRTAGDSKTKHVADSLLEFMKM